MMQRRLIAAFAARHSICSSSSVTKVFLSISSNLCTSCNSSFSYCHDASKDFQKVMNFLSNAPPHGHRYQINSLLNALDFTTMQLQHQQQFVLKVMQTSCQTKLVETPNVSPHDLIRFVKWIWKNNKHLITIPVLESLVSSICSTQSHLKSRKNDVLFLWDLIKHIGHYNTNLLNAHILNKLIEFFSIMGQHGKSALEVFHKFEVFQCVPNQDTYYFTMQALLTTRCSTDMIHQAASICQNMLLLPDDDSSSQHCTHLPPPPPDFDITASHVFQELLELVSAISPLHICEDERALQFMDSTTLPRQHQQHFVLKFIETSCQTKLVETPNVSPHNLIHFVKWVWKNNNNLVTTHVLESLVSAVCTTNPTEFIVRQINNVRLRKNDILLLWDLLKHIGHYHTGLLNTWILNQLLNCFRIMMGEGKTAVEVFHKFEVFQCVPNQDTYYFTVQALMATNCSTDMLQQAASICEKMVLHPETLISDDDDMFGPVLFWFCKKNMIKEAYAIYLAANEKRKRNPNWSPRLYMMYPNAMIDVYCSEKETVYLALEMLTDINIPEEVEQWEKGSKLSLCLLVVEVLCWFKDFDEAKQLIFKMIADGPLPPPSEAVFNVIITAYVKAGEIGQALEMLMLSESIGLSTSHVLTCGFSRSDGMKETRKILEEAKNKDSKLFIALLYHTLIVGYFKQLKYEKAFKLLTQMKDFSVFCTNLDEYHKLIHSLRLKAMDRKIEREQPEELELIDREMAEEQLYEMGSVDSSMAEEQLEEMNLNIRASV